MPTVRELVTRFSFDVDSRGVRKFTNTMSGMERRITRIGAVLGVGFGAKKLADVGLRLDRAANQARRFGAVIDDSNRFVGKIGDTIAALRNRVGAFDQALPLEAFTTFQNLVEGFDKINVPFEEFFKFGVLIAKSGQEDLDTVMQALAQSLETGSVDLLEKLPGFGARLQARIEKVFGITGPGFFLKPEQRPQFFNTIFEELRKLEPELEKSASTVKDTASGAATEFTSEFETAAARLGNTLVKLLTKPLQLLTELLSLINDESPDLPVLSKIAEFLGVIGPGAKLGRDEIKKLKTLTVDLAAGMVAGIGIGLILGLPPIMGAVLGLGGGAGLNKLRDISEEQAADREKGISKRLFPGIESPLESENLEIDPNTGFYRQKTPKVPDESASPTNQTPLSGLFRSGSNVSITVNIQGDDTRTIGRKVVERLEEAISQASREFQTIEGVS